MSAIGRSFSAMRRNMENLNNTENMPPALASKSNRIGKENLVSERRHFGRKQAFGELKNVLHNTGAPTPMKALKNQIFSPAPKKKMDNPLKRLDKSKTTSTATTATTASRKIRTVPCIDTMPIFDPDHDLEFQWAQRTARLAETNFARLNSCIDDDDLLLPLPDVSSMESLESVFGKIEPVAGDLFGDFLEPEIPPLPSLPSLDWDLDMFVN